MGLVFAVQPDLRHSVGEKHLELRSSKRRFSLGMGFIFGGALLATMFLAASPLFKLLWTEGTYFDKAVTAFILALIGLYPLLAIACWFFEERVIVDKVADLPGTADLWNVEAYSKVLGFRWNRRRAERVRLEQFTIENWKGAVNVASLTEASGGPQNRYATKGHWILKVKDTRLQNGEISLERRAKQYDVELVLAQIKAFFSPPIPE